MSELNPNPMPGGEFLFYQSDDGRIRLQNKMHWAAHGQTAAEVIHARVDGTKPHAGMTNWVGPKPGKAEAIIAKNYLTPSEITGILATLKALGHIA